MQAMKTLLDLVRRNSEEGRTTVAVLADACDCSREYIYKMLREDSHPTVPMAEKLARAVGAEITVKLRKSGKIPA